MNNTSGERVQKTEEFKEKLEKRTGLEVIFWDERLSTVSAMEVLKEGNVRRENRKQYVERLPQRLFCKDIWILYKSKKEETMANDGTIMLTAEDGSEDAFFVWEKADIAGRQYLQNKRCGNLIYVLFAIFTAYCMIL